MLYIELCRISYAFLVVTRGEEVGHFLSFGFKVLAITTDSADTLTLCVWNIILADGLMNVGGSC